MRIKILKLFLVFLLYNACNNPQKENSEINTFLKTNYEFNSRVLNLTKAKYYNLVSDQSSRRNIELEKIDIIFQSLIKEIDKAIIMKEDNIKTIIDKRENLLLKIPKTINNRKDFQIHKIKNIALSSNELQLNYIKNELVIALCYAFEYNSLITSINDSLSYVKVDNIEFRKTNNKYILTLSSKYGQRFPENRHILIKSIQENKNDKHVSYKIKDNYSFANIEFDTLQKGNYKINGVLKFYERDGEFEIPFEKTFSIE